MRLCDFGRRRVGVGDGAVEFFSELVAGVGVVLFVEGFDVAMDCGIGDAEGGGDGVVRLAGEEKVKDLLPAF